MRREDAEKAETILKDFKHSIDLKLDEFSSLFRRISNNCLQAFEFGSEDDVYGIPEDQFRDSITNIFFQLQNFLDK